VQQIILKIHLPFYFSTAQISPIALPQLDVTGLPLVNEQGIVYGFGYEDEVNRVRSEFLMRAFKRAVTQELCASTFSMFPNVNPTFFCMYSCQLCAKSHYYFYLKNIHVRCQ
jgi:hypothetical protein